ncbi:glycosyltransferase involved in cell wall biosynthesis [Pedobacter sp. CG_S7]|uniref:glycosyltransferase family 2 protein n=1 Tax=Pedobacter sp. CG_S7 TaxID=3143930 RepID=UPI0033977F1D
MNEKISVCIATFNGEKYIYQQLESILCQLKIGDEIIISDDSSTDHTLEIIRSFNDKRIIVLEKQVFKNPIFNFENAINNATGSIIFLSDQDDVWLEGKVSTMMDALQDHDLVVSNAIIGDSNLKVVKDSYFEWRNSRSGLFKNFMKNSYLGCCMAFRREILAVILPFPKKIPMHDMWIGIMAELYFKPIFINNRLIIYRRHNSNTTVLSEDFTSNESLMTKVKFRIDLLIEVVNRSVKKTLTRFEG